MREWNGRYRDNQRGACLEAMLKSTDRQGVVVLAGSISLEVYRREEGEETVNTEQTHAWQDKKRC